VQEEVAHPKAVERGHTTHPLCSLLRRSPFPDKTEIRDFSDSKISSDGCDSDSLPLAPVRPVCQLDG
jgi:hypothetical protein